MLFQYQIIQNKYPQARNAVKIKKKCSGIDIIYLIT